LVADPRRSLRGPGLASRRSSSSPVRAKWPRWLVARVSSKPSSVRWQGTSMTPLAGRPAAYGPGLVPQCGFDGGVGGFGLRCKGALHVLEPGVAVVGIVEVAVMAPGSPRVVAAGRMRAAGVHA